MILTKELWEYFSQQQEKLDKAFAEKARWKPSLSDRKLAYRIEKAEFINEFPEQVKWWKHTENKRERILDEFGDMIHFVAGYSNTRYPKEGLVFRGVTLIEGDQHKKVFERIENKYYGGFDKWEKYTTKQLLKKLIKTRDLYKSFALALMILDRELGIDADDLRAAYDQKNAENFERIASGY